MPESCVRVLSAHPEDRAPWLELWHLCGREPFAHPDYVDLFAGPAGRAVLFTVADEIGCAIMPLVVREVGQEAWARSVSAVDAASPYGYGGPFASRPREFDTFWRHVSDWMHGENIASLFGRLSLDVRQPDTLPPGMAVRPIAENIVVDLRRPSEEQWMHYAHKVRKNVNKARRAGLSAAVHDHIPDIDEFTSLYHSTMVRRNAGVQYFFDREFFERVSRDLGDSFLLAEVREPSGRLVSAELVLKSDTYVYSFLGGTEADAFSLAPNDLLKHEVIEVARDRGHLGYVLGGGYTANDGIIKYKRGFDPTGASAFRGLEASVLPLSRQLLELRMEWERQHGRSPEFDAAFFPDYRAPLTLRTSTDQDTHR